MLISHRYKFIYLKTKKTGGTSVEVALEPLAHPEGAEVTLGRGGRRDGAVETEAGVVSGRGNRSRHEKWGAHMGASAVKAQLSDEVWNTYLKICNVRNPWDKTVSFFHMHHPDVKGESKDAIVETFRDWLVGARNLGEDLHIYAIDGQPVIDEFIHYETLEEDYGRVCERLGVPAVELPSMKANFRGTNKIPYQEYYDDESREIVAEAYERDIEILGWTFDGRA